MFVFCSLPGKLLFDWLGNRFRTRPLNEKRNPTVVNTSALAPSTKLDDASPNGPTTPTPADCAADVSPDAAVDNNDYDNSPSAAASCLITDLLTSLLAIGVLRCTTEARITAQDSMFSVCGWWLHLISIFVIEIIIKATQSRW